MHEMEEKKKQQALDLERLNNMVTRIEGEMEQLRKKYERAVQEQSERYTCEFDVIWCLILSFMNHQYFPTYKHSKLEILKDWLTTVFH